MRGFVTQKMGRKGWYPVLSLPGNRKKWLRRCLTKREAENLITQEVAKYQSSGWYPSASVLCACRSMAPGLCRWWTKVKYGPRISVGLTGALASRVWMLPAGPHHARGRPVFCQQASSGGNEPSDAQSADSADTYDPGASPAMALPL